MDDTALILGGDAMMVATRGYLVLKAVRRSEGLDGYRQELASRYVKPRAAKAVNRAA